MFGYNNDRLFPEKYTDKDHISNTKLDKDDNFLSGALLMSGSTERFLLECKKMSFQKKNSSNLTGLVWDTNMAAILFSRDTEMADVTSCEKDLLLIIFEFKVSIKNTKIYFLALRQFTLLTLSKWSGLYYKCS